MLADETENDMIGDEKENIDSGPVNHHNIAEQTDDDKEGKADACPIITFTDESRQSDDGNIS